MAFWELNLTELVNAARSGDLETVKKYIKCDLLCGYRALPPASESGQYEVVDWLLNDLIKFTHNNIDYESLAIAAAGKGHTNVMFLILRHFPQFRSTEKLDKNKIMAFAAQGGHLQTVEALFKSGATDIAWALNTAAANGHFDVVKALTAKGDKNPIMTIDSAVCSKNLEMIQWLLETHLHRYANKDRPYIIRRAMGNCYMEDRVPIKEWLLTYAKDHGITV